MALFAVSEQSPTLDPELTRYETLALVWFVSSADSNQSGGSTWDIIRFHRMSLPAGLVSEWPTIEELSLAPKQRR
ncbi:MAG TPA: hypothetical protein VFA90_19310 [Terriglobales bacterium]|nr:hypothetical protein [Terriglobales bacterium]